MAAMAVVAAGILVALPAGASADTGAKEFKATLSGEAAFTSETTVSWVGSGIATHMGLTSNEAHITVTGFDDSCAGGLANTNVQTLTAADGSTLTITSADVACPVGGYRYHGTGHWTVIGGTGRFSGASGQGFADGEADFIAHTFTVTLTGSLVTSS